MTLKEKLIIVAIILLLAFGLTLGPAEAQEPPPEAITEAERVLLIEESILIGRDMDTMSSSIKYGNCYEGCYLLYPLEFIN
jgi:hypothetical protein